MSVYVLYRLYHTLVTNQKRLDIFPWCGSRTKGRITKGRITKGRMTKGRITKGRTIKRQNN